MFLFFRFNDNIICMHVCDCLYVVNPKKNVSDILDQEDL